MTCIVGIAENEHVWIGGDSFGGGDFHMQATKNPKVFTLPILIAGNQNNPERMLVGVAGSFRILNILEHGLIGSLMYDGEANLREWMTEFFAEKLRELFKTRGVTQMINDTAEAFDSEFLIGFHGNLFTMQEDFAVMDWSGDTHAIGAGEEFALGSLHTSAGRIKSPVKRIELALKAASKFCPQVIPPYTILSTKN